MLIVGFNLASSDYRRSRRVALLLGGVLTALLILLALQLVAWNTLRTDGTGAALRLGTMQAEVARYREQVRAVRGTIPADTIKQYEAKVAAYNQILETSVFSWIGLLVELERSVPPGVILAEIHPDLATGRVALRGTAGSFEGLTKLLTGLEQRTTFRDVYLMRQSTKNLSGGDPEVLEFSVSFVYQGHPR